MDKFVEAMLKSAKENKKAEPQKTDVDPAEIERLTKELQEKLQKK